MKFALKLPLIIASILFLNSCATNDPNREPSIEEKKASVYYDQGTNELVSNNYQAALIAFLKAKELAPKDSKIRNNLGMAYYFRNQSKLAVAELKEAIDIDQKNTDAKMNLASIYFQNGDSSNAKKLYEECLNDLTFNSLYRVHYNLGLVHLKIGDRKSAIEELNLAIKEKEDYCPAQYKLGEIYFEEYRFNDALTTFNEAIKGTCVNNPDPHYALALVLINLNRTEEGKAKLREIIEKFPKSNFKILAEKKLKNINNDVEKDSGNISELPTNQNMIGPKF